jgi:hypothetical protein
MYVNIRVQEIISGSQLLRAKTREPPNFVFEQVVVPYVHTSILEIITEIL